MMKRNPWYVYILHCGDGTLYTGITTDLLKRLNEHNGDDARGAHYTRFRRPVRLVYAEEVESRSAAARREYRIKKLPVRDKRKLIDSTALTDSSSGPWARK